MDTDPSRMIPCLPMRVTNLRQVKILLSLFFIFSLLNISYHIGSYSIFQNLNSFPPAVLPLVFWSNFDVVPFQKRTCVYLLCPTFQEVAIACTVHYSFITVEFVPRSATDVCDRRHDDHLSCSQNWRMGAVFCHTKLRPLFRPNVRFFSPFHRHLDDWFFSLFLLFCPFD